MNLVFTPTAWEQYTSWQREDKKMVKRINDLIKSIDRDGLLQGIGKPEPLKHRKACSRRITEEHRLTYNRGIFGFFNQSFPKSSFISRKKVLKNLSSSFMKY